MTAFQNADIQEVSNAILNEYGITLNDYMTNELGEPLQDLPIDNPPVQLMIEEIVRRVFIKIENRLKNNLQVTTQVPTSATISGGAVTLVPTPVNATVTLT